MDRDEFYVGYLPDAPPATARFLKRTVAAMLALCLAAGAALVVSQRGFGNGAYEFGSITEFEGVLLEHPSPLLAVPRPGGDGASLYHLVGPFKSGAAALIQDLDRRRAKLKGSLIYRDGVTMIEVAEVQPLTGLPEQLPDRLSLGRVELSGEIVDSKCYLGAMKPGNLKSHKSCAVRCISGGIPPILLVTAPDGRTRTYLLTGPEGESIGSRVLGLVAEPVRVNGELAAMGDLWVLRIDPAAIEKR